VAVNGRWVRADNLTRGIDDAYRATLPAGRYPPVARRINVDPRRVDVNVHPTKQIVRFSEERAARAAVATSIREAIEWRPPPPPAAPRPAQRPHEQESFSSLRTHRDYARVAERRPDYYPPARDLREARDRLVEASTPLTEAFPENRPGAASPEQPEAPEIPERGALPRLEESRVIGQLAAGYILVEEPGSLWIVDQHVAHERAILDRLNDAEEESAGESFATTQALLVPEVVELSPGEAASAAEYLEELAVYGFEAEPFGPGSFRITGVISTLAGRDVAGAFKEALAAAKGTEPGRRREDHILATIACHSAVKLGDKLSQPEMEALIKSWLTSRLPATCPHGRSICYRIGTNEIARKLDRH
jgi:DNA mismatch repair protein MutL